MSMPYTIAPPPPRGSRLRAAAETIALQFAARHGATVREEGRCFIGRTPDGREFAVSW